MTHQSSHVIIRALLSTPDITPGDVIALEAIQARNQFSRRERWFIAWLVYRLLEG